MAFESMPPLIIEEILDWADSHHERTGDWPYRRSGPIPETRRETWAAVNTALRKGCRGLSSGSTLAQLLAEHRGARRARYLPPVVESQILKWADAHFRRTGKWPRSSSGPIAEAPGETWKNISQSLRLGHRSFPKGGSLRQLLERERGVRNPATLPKLQVHQILEWADAYYARTGRWPALRSGSIPESPSDNWQSINQALYNGLRGLPRGLSVARLLAEHRGIRKGSHLPPLSEDSILAWADAHHRRTGGWPSLRSGPIPDAPGESWINIYYALSYGSRGLSGGSSLAQLLVQHRGARSPKFLPPISEPQILDWADAYFRRTGKWPRISSGPVEESPGDTWENLSQALYRGLRGLPKGGSLPRLLKRERGVRNQLALADLRVEQILEWADAHYARFGDWPTRSLGSISDAPGETWSSVNRALVNGARGLPGGSSLVRLFRERRKNDRAPETPDK